MAYLVAREYLIRDLYQVPRRYVFGFEDEAYWLTEAGQAALNADRTLNPDRPLADDEWWRTPAFEAEVRERGDGDPFEELARRRRRELSHVPTIPFY